MDTVDDGHFLAGSLRHLCNSITTALLCAPFAFLLPLSALRPAVAWCSYFLLLALWWALHRRSQTTEIYALEVACYKAPSHWRVPYSHFMEHATLSGRYSEKSIQFQKRLMERADIGETVAVPPLMHLLPPVQTHAASIEEAEIVLFECMANLLGAAGVRAADIDVLVVNCSIFNPAPSLTAMIVRRFQLRDEVRTFNVAGMGCSANVIAVDVARASLAGIRGGGYAAVLSTENITQNWYFGENEAMLVSNVLFRMGCGAVLLCNKRAEKKRAKYQLLHVVRTHRAGVSNRDYHAAFQEEDSAGTIGVNLSKHIMDIASDALRANLAELAPLVLPINQLLWLFLLRLRSASYFPPFNSIFQHICIHTGGKAVIKAVEKGLRLRPETVEPAKMTLFEFGNTSSASTWYQFQYLESRSRMRKGQLVWQICLGSGFKCNSAIWLVLRDVPPPPPPLNAWDDFFQTFVPSPPKASPQKQ